MNYMLFGTCCRALCSQRRGLLTNLPSSCCYCCFSRSCMHLLFTCYGRIGRGYAYMLVLVDAAAPPPFI